MVLDFLRDIKDFTLYQHLENQRKRNKKRTDNEIENEIKIFKEETLKTIKASATKSENIEIKHNFTVKNNNISNSSSLESKVLNSNESLLKGVSTNNKSKILNLGVISGSGTVAKNVSLSSGLATFYKASKSNFSVATINQYGIVKLTGTEGKNQNGYTIGKGAGARAASHIDYITREENGKEIASIKNRYGEVVANKKELKETLKDISAERRFVLSPNPRLNLDEKTFDTIVRETLNEYGEKLVNEFDYYYAIHTNTKNMHAHILMTSNDPSGDGIKLFKDELFELKVIFDDKIKEHIKDLDSNIKDETDLRFAQRIAKFIGDIPDTNVFNKNIYLAEKIAKNYDLDFNKEIDGENLDSLEKWFDKNYKYYQEYFLNSENKKEAFLFSEFKEKIVDVSYKYNLKIDKDLFNDVEKLKSFIEQNKDLFLADAISTKTNTSLTFDDIANEKNLYKWFQKNIDAVKEYNEMYKNYPSKDMHSKIELYSKKVDVDLDEKIFENRVEAIKFVREYTRNPLQFAGEARKGMVEVLEARKEQLKEIKDLLVEKDYKFLNNRLESLIKKISLGWEVTDKAIERYFINTKNFNKIVKEVELDGYKLNDEKKEYLQKLLDEKLEKEDNAEITKKINAIKYVIEKTDQIAVSTFENIGISRDDIELDIDKIKAELKIMNFKDTQIDKDKFIQEEIDKKDQFLNSILSKYKTTIEADIEKLKINDKTLIQDKEEKINLKELDTKELGKLFNESNDYELKRDIIKEFGQRLDIDVNEIKKDIWFEVNGSLDKFEGFGEKIIKDIDNFDEIFLEKYLFEISLNINEEMFENEKDFVEFIENIDNFKEEFKEQKEYQNLVDEIKESLSYGEFFKAMKLIEENDLKLEDRLILMQAYEDMIEKQADDIMDDVADNIISQMEIEEKKYFLEIEEKDNEEFLNAMQNIEKIDEEKDNELEDEKDYELEI